MMKDIQAGLWTTSYVRNYDKIENWIPITSLEEDEICLGISEAGYWVLEVDEYIVPLLENRYLRDLLPCLKKPFNAMVSLVDEELRLKSLPAEIRDSFPFQSLVSSGLKSKSDFWANLALDWLDNFSNIDFVNEELSELVQAKWTSQKTKQRAKKALKSH